MMVNQELQNLERDLIHKDKEQISTNYLDYFIDEKKRILFLMKEN